MAASVTSIVARPASEKGAIDGFECKCETCGMVIRSSMRTIIEADVAAHIAFHAKRGA